jgi:DNA-binding transcriptional ArsR family regulator
MTRTAVDTARAAQLFHALSDETRVSILEMLRDGERCVCELQADLAAAQSRLSFHLDNARRRDSTAAHVWLLATNKGCEC